MNITVEDNEVRVESAYNREFVAGAKKLSGKWRSPEWVFPIEVKNEVKNLCLACYGDDGDGVGETVTIRLKFPKGASARRQDISVAGRQIARAFGRDSGAKWGDGVICRKGDCGSGGSVKNWETVLKPGTVVDVLRVPKSLVEKFDGTWDDGLGSGSGEPYGAEVVDEAIDRDALSRERDSLKARIAEIDAILETTSA